MALTLQRAPLVILPLLVLAGCFVTLRPAALGGPVQYVIVVGQSMEPTLYPGSTEPATRFGCRDTQTGAPLKLG